LTTARAASASRIFFPLAAAYALLVLPASVLPMLGIAPLAPGLASPAAHAHDLLFGIALLVVAGQAVALRVDLSLAGRQSGLALG
jgi:uncharacterized protein involved in response to NO